MVAVGRTLPTVTFTIILARGTSSWRRSGFGDAGWAVPVVVVRGTFTLSVVASSRSGIGPWRSSWLRYAGRAMPVVVVRSAFAGILRGFRLRSRRGAGFRDTRGAVPVVVMGRTSLLWIFRPSRGRLAVPYYLLVLDPTPSINSSKD